MKLKISFLNLLTVQLAIVANVVLITAQPAPPVVEVSQGKLQGKTLLSRDGRAFSAFLKVPYAMARRFQPPSPGPKWEGTWPATEYGDQCAQSMWVTNEGLGTENCLHVNVFSPNLNGTLPVMVYFHGGGFTIGTGNLLGPEYFMDENVVLVLVNYRLGPFGFLSTHNNTVPGNNGLRDQNMALRWVRENIAQFGGNPRSVTIFGNSAGGASVHYHLLSPQSQGLFHGAILQSGSALNPWARTNKPEEAAYRLAKSLNCPSKTSEQIYQCLLSKRTEHIVEALKSLVQWGYDPFSPFAPVVEHDHPQAFIKEEPEIAMGGGHFNKVPIMMGVVEDEGILMHSAYVFQNPQLLADINERWEKFLPITLEYDDLYTNYDRHTRKELSMKIRKYYFDERTINQGTRQQLTNLYSDRYFNHGVRKAALLMARHTPVYMYQFAHNRGDYSLLKFFGIDQNLGVAHADELSFLFAHSFNLAPEFVKGSPAEQVSKRLVKLWVSFARDKMPTAQWPPAQNWVPVTSDEIIGRRPLTYYRIDSQTSVITEPFTDRALFWDRIFQEARPYPSRYGRRDEL